MVTIFSKSEKSGDSCGNIPDNFIEDLTALESLTLLEFGSIPSLLDAAFTAKSINRFAGNIEDGSGTSLMAPAITCFKSLKTLNLYWCSGITDDCVTNGISKSKTLQTLEIRYCEGLTKICKNLCKFEVRYENSDTD